MATDNTNVINLAKYIAARVAEHEQEGKKDYEWLEERWQCATACQDVIEELPTPVRAALVKAEQPEAEQRNLLVVASLNPSEKRSTSCSAPRNPSTLMTSSNDPA